MDKNEIDRVEKAIAAAESKTNGELVVMIAKQTAILSHVPYMIFLIFMSLWGVSGADQLISQKYHLAPMGVQLIGVLGVAFISWGLSGFSFTRRLLSNRADVFAQIFSRATALFYEHRVNATRGSTGILIYVTLAEHQVLVLGDKAISEKIQQADWQHIVDAVIAGLKKGDLCSGLENGIDLSGQLLSKNFPADRVNPNEISNKLILI